MAAEIKLDRGPGTLVVSGALSFANATAALQALSEALRAGDCPQIDLAGVRTSDSAGLACVLAVLAEVRGRGQSASLLHVPEGMRTLAQVSGVEALLA